MFAHTTSSIPLARAAFGLVQQTFLTLVGTVMLPDLLCIFTGATHSSITVQISKYFQVVQEV